MMTPPVLPVVVSHSVSTTRHSKYRLQVLPGLLCLHWSLMTPHLLHLVKDAAFCPARNPTLIKHPLHPKRLEEMRSFRPANPAKSDYIHLFTPISFPNVGMMYNRVSKTGDMVGALIDAISCPRCDLLLTVTIQWRMTDPFLPLQPVRIAPAWDLHCPHSPTSTSYPRMSIWIIFLPLYLNMPCPRPRPLPRVNLTLP
jgi:hypothetical protein